MKVSELIVELQKMPQDAVVILVESMPNQTDYWNQEVRDVVFNKDGTVELDNWPPTHFLRGMHNK